MDEMIDSVEYLRYFDWLKSIILPYPGYNHYDLLVEKLFFIKFSPVIKRDENRADDGLYMRNDYKYYTDNNDAIFEYRPCSILEMLIALSGRMDGGVDICVVNNKLESAAWFWRFIENLGLDKFDNSHYDESRIEIICQKFVERDYDFNGDGGLFPLKNPTEDQRYIEIWSQAQAYLIENFGVYDFA